MYIEEPRIYYSFYFSSDFDRYVLSAPLSLPLYVTESLLVIELRSVQEPEYLLAPETRRQGKSLEG